MSALGFVVVSRSRAGPGQAGQSRAEPGRSGPNRSHLGSVQRNVDEVSRDVTQTHMTIMIELHVRVAVEGTAARGNSGEERDGGAILPLTVRVCWCACVCWCSCACACACCVSHRFSSVHQPQWASPAPRQSLQLLHWSHLATFTLSI